MLGTTTTRVLQITEGILHTQRLDFLHPLVSSKDQSKHLIRLVYNALRRPLFVNNFSCDGPGRPHRARAPPSAFISARWMRRQILRRERDRNRIHAMRPMKTAKSCFGADKANPFSTWMTTSRSCC